MMPTDNDKIFKQCREKQKAYIISLLTVQEILNESILAMIGPFSE